MVELHESKTDSDTVKESSLKDNPKDNTVLKKPRKRVYPEDKHHELISHIATMEAPSNKRLSKHGDKVMYESMAEINRSNESL